MKVGFSLARFASLLTEIGAQCRHSRKLCIDFAVVQGIRDVMPIDHGPTPQGMIAQPMLAAYFLMEEASPELATPIDPKRDALEARVKVVERAAEELGTIAAMARAISRTGAAIISTRRTFHSTSAASEALV